MEKAKIKEAGQKSGKTFVYIVKCEDGSLYTGIARDIKKRMREHYDRKAKGAKYTKSHPVTAVMMVWEASSYSLAAKLEYAIKQLPRRDKLKMIASPIEQQKKLIPGLSEESYIPRREFVMDVEILLGIEKSLLKKSVFAKIKEENNKRECLNE